MGVGLNDKTKNMITVLKQVSSSGNIEYYDADTVQHRSNGPAVYWEKSREWMWFWFLHGKRHRYYGPSNDDGEWYLHGKKIKAI
jgi:hypothetical protein